MNTPRKITIEAVLNGFVCKVGCQTVVFDSRTELVNHLLRYLEHPAEVEQGWRQNAMHKEMISGPECPPPPPYDSCDKPSAPVSLRQAIRPATAQCEANQCDSPLTRDAR